MLCLTPSCFIKAAHTAEENCTPLSEVKEAGTPNLETQPLTNASAQSAVVVARSGQASAHLVDLSTAVNR
jgi:hypothetical protein